jgi:hypothetical protein
MQVKLPISFWWLLYDYDLDLTIQCTSEKEVCMHACKSIVHLLTFRFFFWKSTNNARILTQDAIWYKKIFHIHFSSFKQMMCVMQQFFAIWKTNQLRCIEEYRMHNVPFHFHLRLDNNFTASLWWDTGWRNETCLWFSFLEKAVLVKVVSWWNVNAERRKWDSNSVVI